MARPRTIPDADIFAAILRLIAEGGEKAVSFSSVAQITKLAAPSLVQRYGSLPGMMQAALVAEWDRIDAETRAAISETTGGGKGPQALFKALTLAPSPSVVTISLRDPALRARADGWRKMVEDALAGRHFDADTASILFALWQGQMMWQGFGDRGFKLKDALKRLS